MADDYFKAMLSRGVRTDGFIDPCIPTLAAKPPAGPDWDHEIKHDGYRLIVRRDGATVRLFTRRGYEWTGRFPAITDAAGKLRARTFTLDGEAVVCGADGIAVFDAPRGQCRLREALLYAFDLIEMDGEHLRHWPFNERKTRLERLLAGRNAGIVLNQHVVEKGAVVFA